MIKSTSPEVKQARKKGRPRKYLEGVSEYFSKTGPAPPVLPVKTESELDNSRKPTTRQKLNFHHWISKFKNFAGNCTAISVDLWEALRTDDRNNCGLCGEVIESVNLLIDHLREHICLKCLRCTSHFNHLDSFLSHMTEHTLPLSSAVLNDAIGKESNSYQNKDIVEKFTPAQNEEKISIVPSGVQNEEVIIESMSLPELDSFGANDIDTNLPKTEFQKTDIIVGQCSSRVDGFKETQFQSHKESTAGNRDSGGGHCLFPNINHQVPTPSKPFACSICNFQPKSVTNLCKHNRQFHQSDVCLCQSNCSNENVEQGAGDQVDGTFWFKAGNKKKDHDLRCRPSEIIDLDLEVEYTLTNQSTMETIICDDSSDSCVMLVDDPPQKIIPNPLKPPASSLCSKSLTEGFRIRGTPVQHSARQPVRAPRLPAPINTDEPIELLDDEGDRMGLSVPAAHGGSKVDVCEKRKNRSNSKDQEVRSSESVEISGICETSGSVVTSGSDVTSGSGETEEPGEISKTCEFSGAGEILGTGKISISGSSVSGSGPEPSLDEPSAKRKKVHAMKLNAVTGENHYHSKKSRNRNRVSSYELKSLFYDSPKFLTEMKRSSPTTRVTRRSVSQSENSCLTGTHTPKKPNVERSIKQSNIKRKVLTGLDIEKCNSEPEATSIGDLVGQESKYNKHNKQAPPADLSGQGSSSFSCVVESQSRAVRSCANSRKGKKRRKVTGASESFQEIDDPEGKSFGNHVTRKTLEDASSLASETNKAVELESDILDEYTNFEVVDVRNFNEYILDSFENEMNDSLGKDPLASSLEEAFERHVTQVMITCTDTPIPLRVVEPANCQIKFDHEKFTSEILSLSPIQIEDVPVLANGQWIVYKYFWSRFDQSIESILVFPNKNCYLEFFQNGNFNTEVLDDSTFFCDYAHGNNTTALIKFGKLNQPFSSGPNKKLLQIENEAAVNEHDSMDLTTIGTNELVKNKNSPFNLDTDSTNLASKDDALLEQVENDTPGSSNVMHEDDGILKNVDGNLPGNQENCSLVEHGCDTLNPSVVYKNVIPEDVAPRNVNGADSVVIDNRITPNPNPENIGGSFTKPQGDAEKECTNKEKAASDDAIDGSTSPVLVNGTMKIFNRKVGVPVVHSRLNLFKKSPDPDVGQERGPVKSSASVQKSTYWGFSSSDNEEGLVEADTPKPKVNGVVEDVVAVTKKSRKKDRNQLDEMLMAIDRGPVGEFRNDYPGKSATIKQSIKTSVPLPAAGSARENFDSSTSIPPERPIENSLLYQRQSNNALYQKPIPALDVNGSRFFVQSSDCERRHNFQDDSDEGESATDDESSSSGLSDGQPYSDCDDHSCSSSSVCPDAVGDIILQARRTGRCSPFVARDPSEFHDCMSPPTHTRPSPSSSSPDPMESRGCPSPFYCPRSGSSSSSMDNYGSAHSMPFMPSSNRRMPLFHKHPGKRFSRSSSLSPFHETRRGSSHSDLSIGFSDSD